MITAMVVVVDERVDPGFEVAGHLFSPSSPLILLSLVS
jgi:hypothetical protein